MAREMREVTSDMSADGTDRYRKLAPKLNDGEWPDWFLSMSGGIDSTAMYLLVRDALHENYGKRPLMTYFDTRIGVPLNRFYLEELADTYSEQLWTLRTHEKFEDRLQEDDAPGAAKHGPVRNELKGRQAGKLNTLASNPVHCIGIRRDESQSRSEFGKVSFKDKCAEVYPVLNLSKRECARIILEHEECPINPFWIWPRLFSDCGCLANGDPSELDAVEEKFPWFAQRLREYEESIEADGLRSQLGWSGLTASEQKAKKQNQEQMTLCGDGCSRRQDPVIAQAFRARLNGASADEAIAMLEEPEPEETRTQQVDLVAATDGAVTR